MTPQDQTLILDSIETAVCRIMDVTPTELRSPGRGRCTQARRVFVYVASSLTGAKTITINTYISNGTTHSTAANALRQSYGLYQDDPDFRAIVDKVRAAVEKQAQ